MPVVVEDYSEKIKESINKKLAAGLQAAADVLAAEYKRGLRATQSPPASRPGEVPHDAPTRPGARYSDIALLIEGAVSINGDVFKGLVGFAGGISSRDNYLLGWDQGTIGPARPWVIPLYLNAKTAMQNAFNAAVAGAG